MKNSISENGNETQLNAKILERLKFVPVGVWSENTVLKFYSPENPDHVSHPVINLQKTDTFFKVPVKTLGTVMNDLGHQHIDILKIDIECRI